MPNFTLQPQQQQQQQQQQQKQDGQGQSKTPKKQVLQGGLVMEEHKTGNGPVAKAGKMVGVREALYPVLS